MHEIQQQILKKLIGAPEPMRYRDIKLPDIENDLFNYHLQHLVSNNVLHKVGSTYSLSAYGLQLVEELFPIGILRPVADKFKLYAHGIVIRVNSGQTFILNRTRTKHPFYGDKGILGASVKKGEDSKLSLQVRLLEQANVQVELENILHACTLRKINKLPNGEIFSDFIFNIYVCLDPQGRIELAADAPNLQWVSIEEAIENELNAKTHLQAVFALLQQVQQGNLSPKLEYTEEIEIVDPQ